MARQFVSRHVNVPKGKHIFLCYILYRPEKTDGHVGVVEPTNQATGETKKDEWNLEL